MKRYLVVCLALYLLMGLYVRTGAWGGDFWEHAAVVRELATNPFDPDHPQLMLDAPHTFFSPYSLLVALAVRTFDMDVVQALGWFGLVNLGVWLLGFWLFTNAMFPTHPETGVYALLLTLLAWGPTAWQFSGFFHLRTLPLVIPYPSTFSAGLGMIGLWMNHRWLKGGNLYWLFPIAIFSGVILISHPLTFLFLLIMLSAQVFSTEGVRLGDWVKLAVVVTLALIPGLAWPYYPVTSLAGSGMAVFNSANLSMYHEVIPRVLPALAGVPFILYSARRRWREPLLVGLILMLGLYLLGFGMKVFAFGRLISFIVLMLHLALADGLARLERILASQVRFTSGWLTILLAGLLLVPGKPLVAPLVEAFQSPHPDYVDVKDIASSTQRSDVILADLHTSWIVPVFGGKVVATRHPLAFVPDQFQRRADVNKFFIEAISFVQRQEIIEKYSVDYLILNRVSGVSNEETVSSYTSSGQIVKKNKQYILVKLWR